MMMILCVLSTRNVVVYVRHAIYPHTYNYLSLLYTKHSIIRNLSYMFTEGDGLRKTAIIEKVYFFLLHCLHTSSIKIFLPLDYNLNIECILCCCFQQASFQMLFSLGSNLPWLTDQVLLEASFGEVGISLVSFLFLILSKILPLSLLTVMLLVSPMLSWEWGMGQGEMQSFTEDYNCNLDCCFLGMTNSKSKGCPCPGCPVGC